MIFDLDGTLIDSRHDLADAVNLMRKDFNLEPLSLNSIVSYLGNGVRLLAERATADAKVDIDEAASLFKKHYKEKMLDNTVTYPGVAEGLPFLCSKGWQLAVITNKPTLHCHEILAYLGLEKNFSVIIGSDSGFPLKPEPDSALFILEKTKAVAEQSWIIGDNYTDMATGRRARLKRCFAGYGFGKLEEEFFDMEISSFQRLIETI
jgi:phosphoglycolate phosphatase